jgi:ribosome modulation factor
MRYSDKLAFARGYHDGITGSDFMQPYESHELVIQFEQGYKAGHAVLMDELETQLTKLEEKETA